MDNRRARERVDYSNQILCYKHIITTKDVKPDPSPIRIFINDVSYSGLGITCNRDLGIGDFLIFNLENGGEVKEFMMEVKWCKYMDGEHEAGLQFMNLTKDAIYFLDHLIKGHIRKKKRQVDSVNYH